MKRITILFVLTLMVVGISACSQSAPLPTSALTIEASPTPSIPKTAYPADLEVITPENVHRLEQLERWGDGFIFDAALSPDGRILAVRTARGIDSYDPETLEIKHQIDISPPETKGRILSLPLAFSPSGNLLAYTDNIYIFITDTKTGLERNQFQLPPNWYPTALEFSPEGNYLVTTSFNSQSELTECAESYQYRLQFHDIHKRDELFSYTWCSPGFIPTYQFTTSGKLYFFEYNPINPYSSTEESRMIEIDLENNSRTEEIFLRSLRTPNDPINTEEFVYSVTQDGLFLIARRHEDGLIYTRILNAETRELVESIEGQVVILPSEDGNPQWSHPEDVLQTPQVECKEFETLGNPMISHPSENIGYRVLRYFPAQRIELWDLSSCELLKFKDNQVFDLAAFSPNGSQIFTESHSGWQSWSLQNDEVSPITKDTFIKALSGRNESPYHATNPGGGIIQIFERETDSEVTTLRTDAKFLSYPYDIVTEYTQFLNENNLVFSPDGSLLVVKTLPSVEIWDVHASELIMEFPINLAILDLSFSPDGKLMATTTSDGLLRLWGVPAENND
jgi:WD40 repeat protein